jgi:anti-anti-sigma factor
MEKTTVTAEGGRAVIEPAGDIVAASVDELRSILKEAMDNGARQLVIDFGKVRMLDSRGIGLLIAAHNSLRRQGGTLELVGVSKDILELLQMMRMHQHFRVSAE